MAFFAAAAGLTVLLLLAVGRAVLSHRDKREKKSMRDHLSRISEASE